MTTANADPLLIVGVTLLIIMMLVINVYTLVYWQHPDDRNESYFAKGIIIFGLQLSSMSVLMLPIGTSLFSKAATATPPRCPQLS